MKIEWLSSLPPWVDNSWVMFLLLLACAYLCFFLTKSYLTSLVIAFFKKRKLIYDKSQEQEIMTPFGITAFFVVLYYGQPWVSDYSKTDSILARVSLIGLTVGAVWAAFNLVNVFSLYFEKKAQATASKFDDVLIPLLRSCCKVLVFSIGVVLVGHSLSIDVKSIIAGLGIGGIALALAAKDTLSNLFGSLMVILDRPFEIGDWVTLENGVEGTVLRVGLRSTRIKTFYDSEVAIPNNQLGNMHIDNYGRRKYRRFSTKIGIQYDTPPEKIEAFCEGIRKLILEHPHGRKDYFHVYLNELDSSSLNILVYMFWRVDDWSQELTERHRLLVDILRLGKAMEVEFAFPTQTLHVFNEDRQQDQAIPENFHESGQKMARDISQKRISPLRSRSSLDETQRPPLE